jgi:xylulokinase
VARSVASIRRVLSADGVAANRIVGIGLTGQMHGLVLLDSHGNVLRPAILWNDQRTGSQCAAITKQIGLPQLLTWIANPVLPGFTAPKIVWVREHEPTVYAHIAHVLLPKDYVRYRLTGALVTDVSDASGTALFDVSQRRWSDDMVRALGLQRAWLPECLESSMVSGNVSAEAAHATGLLTNTPVAADAGDQAAQAVGCGSVKAGIMSVTLGTSGVVFATTEKFWVEPEGRLHAFCHAVSNQWHVMGVMLSAAGSLRWYRDALGEAAKVKAKADGVDVYEVLTAQARTAPAGSEGLIFLPYLTGERTPHPDPEARGVYFGLSLRHGAAHLVRAVLEGVVYVLSTAMVMVNSTEGAAYGAALLAGVGAGVYRDVSAACARVIRVTDTLMPSDQARVYGEYYAIYRALYPVLAPLFKQVSAITAREST